MLEGIPDSRGRTLVAALLIAFQFAALRHNLAIWEGVSRASRITCLSAREQTAGGPREIETIGIPGSIRGVYFFWNGLQQCLETGDQHGWRVTMLPAGTPPSGTRPVLEWTGEAVGVARVDRSGSK